MNMFNSDNCILPLLQPTKGVLINVRDCVECPGVGKWCTVL